MIAIGINPRKFTLRSESNTCNGTVGKDLSDAFILNKLLQREVLALQPQLVCLLHVLEDYYTTVSRRNYDGWIIRKGDWSNQGN